MRSETRRRGVIATVAAAGLVGLSALGAAPQASGQQEIEEFEVATIGIETGSLSPRGEKTGGTDFEVQWFADYTGVVSWEIQGPTGEPVFSSALSASLQEQAASELTFASRPNHPYDPVTYPGETLESFFERFPEGDYTFTGTTFDGVDLRSTATLTHDLPAHPRVRVRLDDDDVTLRWRRVDDCFDEVSCDSVDVVEYSVKVEEEEVERDDFIDGGFTNGTARYQEAHYLPDSVCNRRRCEITMGTEFFVPGNTYTWQVFAIEASGNSTYQDGTFVFDGHETDDEDQEPDDDRRDDRRRRQAR